MRRSFAIGGTLTRGDIETLLDTCDRLLAQHDEMVRILGDIGPAWTDARVALNRLRGPGGTNPDMARPERDGAESASGEAPIPKPSKRVVATEGAQPGRAGRRRTIEPAFGGGRSRR